MRWEPYFSNISYAKNSVAYGRSSGRHGISIGGAAQCLYRSVVSDRSRVNRKDNERNSTRELSERRARPLLVTKYIIIIDRSIQARERDARETE